MKKLFLVILGLVALLIVILQLTPQQKLTDADRAEYIAHDFVKAKLVSPSSAEFCPPDESLCIETPQGYKVTGWVESKNVNNVLVRNYYIALLKKNGSKWECADLTFE